MNIRAWREHKSQRPMQTGDGFVVANEGDTVIIIVARKGEAVFGLIDELLAKANLPEPT